MELHSKSPYLSLVVTSRNDDDQALQRMQMFVNGLVSQAGRHRLNCELIVVEWNYPLDRPRLSQAFTRPRKSEWCTMRVISVPPVVHHTFENSEVIPLFQMIAKNVGIRRAQGSFILATNVDILFSEELMEFLASGKLQDRVMYRVDRYDIPANIPSDLPVDQQLAWCEQNVVRLYRHLETVEIRNGLLPPQMKKESNPVKKLRDLIWRAEPLLHTNACGDFTLLSKRYWEAVLGYPEFPTRAMKLDGLLCYAAHYAGAREQVLKDPMRIYHLEHPARADGAQVALSGRSHENLQIQISPAQYQVWTHQMRSSHRPIIFNQPGWGLAHEELEETIIG